MQPLASLRPKRARCGRALRAGFVALAAATACATAQASVISDASFFNAIPTTVINFETDGNGSAINLIQGQSQAMPLDAYSSLGVAFGTQIRWVNDGNVAFDAAQAAVA